MNIVLYKDILAGTYRIKYKTVHISVFRTRSFVFFFFKVNKVGAHCHIGRVVCGVPYLCASSIFRFPLPLSTHYQLPSPRSLIAAISSTHTNRAPITKSIHSSTTIKPQIIKITSTQFLCMKCNIKVRIWIYRYMYNQIRTYL